MADNVLPFRRRTEPAPAAPDERTPQAAGPVPQPATTPAAAPQSAEPERLWREAVGEQLRERRARRDERITDVADRAGVSPQYLSEIERGLKDPSSEVLAAVTGALGLSVQELARTVSLRLAGGAVGPVCLAA